MAKVMLVLPHLPQRMGSPYLGQQYIAASLLSAGHQVIAIDEAAIRWDGGDNGVLQAAEQHAPDMIGMTLFTYNALRGYALASQLQGKTRCIVAGGPHVTVDPSEPLAHGFHAAISGEGELLVRQLAAFLDSGGDPPSGGGLHWANDPPSCARATLEDLDQLAFPLESYPSYNPAWYSDASLIIPGGLMTSRGCPARCTFCANYVTGRAYRWRSPQNVIREMSLLKERHGVMHFPFWDDAFTARRSRLNDMCDAILAEPSLKHITWTCITPGNMVKPHDLERMRKAGCVAINFGIESGDYNILKDIQKGQRPEHVKEAVAAAKAAGMMTIVNFMFGFPNEGVPELQRTADLMANLSDSTDYFNNRGVLVPFPGTSIYDQHHQSYGFTKWWLNPKNIIDEPNIHVLDPRKVQEYLEIDPTLDLDFFHYSDPVREQIAACVRFKAQHNASSLARMHQNFSHQNSDAELHAPIDAHSTIELQQKTAASVG